MYVMVTRSMETLFLVQKCVPKPVDPKETIDTLIFSLEHQLGRHTAVYDPEERVLQIATKHIGIRLRADEISELSQFLQEIL